MEDEIFRKRQNNELAFKAREKAKRRRSEGFNDRRPNWALLNNTQFAPKVRDLNYFDLLSHTLDFIPNVCIFILSV